MIKIYFFCFFISLAFIGFSQVPETIILNPPDTNRGLPVMKALLHRASVRDFDTTQLKLQDLSDLLWAANGINRPASGKRTAPSAMNSQDIDIYVFFQYGVYLYNAKKHRLDFITGGDHRLSVAGQQKEMAKAPVFLLLVSDISRFPRGNDSVRRVMAAEDAGIVSQNIAIFCASEKLATVPRLSMDHAALRKILKLKDSQIPMMNHPVSYRKN